MKRYGWVIGVKEEKLDEYKKLHAAVWPEVLSMIKDSNLQNYSIYLRQLPDGKYYLFSYFEYTGDDFEADMAKLDKHPRNIEWLKICDPMQNPLEGYDGWAEMEQVYFND